MSAETTIVSSIAERYATALFELASDAGQLDNVERDLIAIAGVLDESEDLRRLVRSPVFSAEEQAAGLNAVLQKLSLGDLATNFVGAVVSNRRLFALADMVTAFRRQAAAARGEMVAYVTSAQPLTDKQSDDLKAQIAAAMKTQVTIEADVDDSLLGGLIVRVGSRMIDTSLRTKLQNLKFAMKGAE